MSFLFEEVFAYATQHTLELDLDAPASSWTFIGTGGRLPDGLTLQATWQELARYGPVRVENRSPRIVALFCRYLWMLFELDSFDVKPDGDDGPRDPASIPPQAHIFGVTIEPGAHHDLAAACRETDR